jgi:hypothetical protein
MGHAFASTEELAEITVERDDDTVFVGRPREQDYIWRSSGLLGDGHDIVTGLPQRTNARR